MFSFLPVRGEIGGIGGGEGGGDVGGIRNNNICRPRPDAPALLSHSAKQINILFVYAENNNYFMVGVVLCTPV